MIYKEFYSELGKLLYAVADIDGAISQKEKKKLQDIVKNELAPVETIKDSFGTDVAFYSEMEFDFMDEEIIDAESAFESFIDFIEEHQTAFDESMKKASLLVAEELANVYYGTNKKEKTLIEKLKWKLKALK
ncbi:MAG: hypothetical protein ACXVPU_08260 [Bacteroidia bacterium]